MAICQHCGEDKYDCDEQVCKACGIVSEEIQFGSEFNPFGPSAKPKFTLYARKQSSPGLEYGIDVLNYLSKKYNLSTDIKSEISDLLRHVYSKMSFRKKQDVGVLAGCCLVQVQRKRKQFVSITDLCAKLNCTKKEAFKFTKVLRKHSNQQDEELCESDCSPDDPVSATLSFKDKMEALVCTSLSSAPEDCRADLVHKTTALTKLAYSCWVASGRSPEGVTAAAAFLCWKSMHPSHKGLPFKQFCSDFSIMHLYGKGRCRVPELKSMLLKLGRNIPSLSENYVNRGNILFHLNYILENSESLRNDLLTQEFTSEEINKKEFSVFRTKPKTKKSAALNTDIQSQYDPDMCASDIEISDTEISSYIRTPEQIEVIKALSANKEK